VVERGEGRGCMGKEGVGRKVKCKSMPPRNNDLILLLEQKKHAREIIADV
jgi:hypothetical protein